LKNKRDRTACQVKRNKDGKESVFLFPTTLDAANDGQGKVSRHGQEIILIGTAHLSKENAELVERVIDEEKLEPLSPFCHPEVFLNTLTGI
jgi:hypothetical protein